VTGADVCAYLRTVIEDRIKTLRAIQEVANPRHRHIYDASIETLHWVLTQIPRDIPNEESEKN